MKNRRLDLMRIVTMLWILIPAITPAISVSGEMEVGGDGTQDVDTAGFTDSAHHWYDIFDEDKIINPGPGQRRYRADQTTEIANNILLYQKTNGGWPKNYDMLAVLTEAQRESLRQVSTATNSTFDNGATHSHVEYLAQAWSMTRIPEYRDACLRGIDFILGAQYDNGGFPQCYPDTSGYRKYITFNDGAMIGVMKVMQNILILQPHYSFVDRFRMEKIRRAFENGLQCILKCQVLQDGQRTAWGQQHDNLDLRPQRARMFEPASVCGDESADIILFLMSIERPGREIIGAVEGGVEWLQNSRIRGIRVETIQAPKVVYRYAVSTIDRIVVRDPKAPPIWARLYELGSNKPLFCNRDGVPVYSLAEVDRERRSGYTWYSYEPEKVFNRYSLWRKGLEGE